MGEGTEYGSEAQNVYQKRLRNEKSGMVTWHLPSNMRETTKQKISSIQQGSNNDTKIAKSRTKGYNRAKWDDICRCMDVQFYLASSKQGDSLHPIKDRPFTIREGCRIHGLPDQLSFDLKTPRKNIAKMVHNSPAPAIGELLALSLGCKI